MLGFRFLMAEWLAMDLILFFSLDRPLLDKFEGKPIFFPI